MQALARVLVDAVVQAPASVYIAVYAKLSIQKRVVAIVVGAGEGVGPCRNQRKISFALPDTKDPQRTCDSVAVGERAATAGSKVARRSAKRIPPSSCRKLNHKGASLRATIGYLKCTCFALGVHD